MHGLAVSHPTLYTQRGGGSMQALGADSCSRPCYRKVPYLSSLLRTLDPCSTALPN